MLLSYMLRKGHELECDSLSVLKRNAKDRQKHHFQNEIHLHVRYRQMYWCYSNVMFFLPLK